ncbi:MAG: peptidylprolyl isomerase [Bdellovibrionales bacterium]|nr:peptidylprolyl isomerase [Bdellovibrionales bacterium]
MIKLSQLWAPIILFSQIFWLPLAHSRTIERILAIVNDEIVLQSDLDSYKSKLASGGLVDDAVLRFSDTKQLLKDQKSLIEHLIDEKIIDSEVKRLGLNVPIEKVEQEIRAITKRNGITRDQLKEALAEKGVSFSEYQNFIGTSQERQAVIEKELSSKIKISDDDVSTYYVHQIGDSKASIFEYTLSQILFLTRNGEEPAREKAQLVLSKLNSRSASFDKLASQFSEDPKFSQGGNLGSFKAGEMLPEIEKAVVNLKPGEVSGIIQTRVGFHIVKLAKKSLVPNPDFEAKKESIRELLFAQAFKQQLRQWLDGKRQDSFIRINLE